MTDKANVDPTPDLADIPMKPAPDMDATTVPAGTEGDDPSDPPADDLTLPTQ